VSPRHRTQRIALYAGGGVLGATSLLSSGLAGLLWTEAKLAGRRIPIATDDGPPSNDTTWVADGVSRTSTPLRLAMLGDSTAVGYGAYRDRDTPGAQVAIGLSEAAQRPVHLTNVAVIGAESPDLAVQVDALRDAQLDLAVIMIGANDVTELTKISVAVPYLEDAVTRLTQRGVEVVVGTCPDLGTIRPLAQPLRAYARRLSRKMAREQTVAVVRAGGRTVSLGDLLGPLFMTNLDFFAEDRFHPSAAGYAEAAQAVLPSCLDALGLRTRTRSASTFTTRRVKSVQKAAAQAVARPGAEVAAAERFGRAEGRRGPLAQLRRRRAGRAARCSPENATSVSTQPSD
jgi:lysophospholipase L1-like esterase